MDLKFDFYSSSGFGILSTTDMYADYVKNVKSQELFRLNFGSSQIKNQPLFRYNTSKS